MRRPLSVISLLGTTILLSGCSQEPAAETVSDASSGDYRYLSQAFRDEQPPSPSTRTPQQTSPVSTPATTSSSAPSDPPIGSTANGAAKESPEEIAEKTPKEASSPSEPKETLSHAKKYDRAIIKTNQGDITLRFYGDEAPKTVDNFLKLADKGFYDGIRFHRVIEGFIIQAGDPNSKDNDWSDDGTGGPGYTFADEINARKIVKGSLAMANSGPDTNGSQFFILTASSAPLLDGKYTCFGEVSDGMDVVRMIEKVDTDERDHPTENITIKSIQLIEKKS